MPPRRERPKADTPEGFNAPGCPGAYEPDLASVSPARVETGPTSAVLEYLHRAASELARRRAESLLLYEPLSYQEPFHASRAKMRLCIGSNRAGKTLPAAAEVARAVTGSDPHGKWPKTDGRFYCVGKDQKHIGQVMWRKLSRAGAFKVVRENGLWRALRPGESDTGARQAPPLIPPRLIDSIGWENKKENVPNIVRLKNGWEMNFFSSLGKPPQGVDIDGYWLDEEIVDSEWIPELAARVLDRRGKGIWSATPQAATEHLYSLHERAANRDPDVEEFFMLLADNPFIAHEEKVSFAAGLNEDEYRVRVLGEFAISGFKVYPEFDMRVHGCEAFEVPADWARYMIVDPGRQVCAVLFAAVPPSEEFVYFYDELYLKRCSAIIFAEEVARRIGDWKFEAFIIDHSGGRITDMGGGRDVETQYSEQLAERKVESRRTSSGFLWGSDDVKGGLEAFRNWLRVRPSGHPRLQVMRGRLPNLEWEMKHYHFRRKDGILTDEPVRKNDHAVSCARYLAAFDPEYVKPLIKKMPKSYVLAAMEKKRKRQKKQNYVRLGAGNPE